MASATASPRYAPDDPSLPKPWKGLVDGKTGYLYYWNPETNVTQYEKPAASSRKGSAPPQKSSAAAISSSVQIQQSSLGKHRDSGYDDDDPKYSRGSNATSKLASGTRSYQVFVLLMFKVLIFLLELMVYCPWPPLQLYDDLMIWSIGPGD